MGSIILNKEFNPIIFKNVLRKHWYKPLILLCIGLITSYIYLRYTKQTFESTATIQIVEEDRVKDVLGEQGISQQSTDISKEVELLRSDVLFSQMLKKLNLNISIYSEGQLLTKDLYGFTPFTILAYELKDSLLCGSRIDLSIGNNNKLKLSYQIQGKKYAIDGDFNQKINNKHFEILFRTSNLNAAKEAIENNKIHFNFNNQNKLLNEMKSGLNITILDQNAKTIQISYKHNNPNICLNVVQNLMDVYLNYDKRNKQSKTDLTINFIDEQLDSLSRILKNSKDSLSDFQRNERLPNIENVETQLSNNINELTNRLLEINEEISTLAMVNNKISIDPNRLEIYRLIPEMVGKKSFEGTVLRQIEDLNKLLETQEDLLRDVTPDNKQNKVINERISNRIVSIKRSLALIEDRLKNDKALVQAKINEIEGKYYGLPEKKMEFDRLKYMEELNNRYFSLFTEKKIEYELSNAGYSSSNRILNEATLPIVALYPKSNFIYFFCCLIGFLTGLGFIFFKYLSYNDITSVQDLQTLLPAQANILGSVPIYRKKLKYSEIVVNESSKSRLAEAIRNIRANMSFINKDSKVIAVSSSISGEGKTFVILNLAGLIAASGKKTLVIDLDLRKPKVHHGFRAKNDNGMSNYISGLASFEEVINHSSITNLDFITAGLIPPNPSELIQSESFQVILSSLKEKYDVILIDNPPVGIVSDGIHILAQADIPIYVFKANYSKRIFAERVDELFKVQKLKSLNIILNGVESHHSIYGYGYQYGYQYGYSNSGYYSDDKSEFFLYKWIKKMKDKWKR
jgi:capsular exopolysaccharide synthesis family protein